MLVLQKGFRCVLRHKWRYTMSCQNRVASVEVTSRSDAHTASQLEHRNEIEQQQSE